MRKGRQYHHEQYAVFLERRHRGEEDDERRCLTVECYRVSFSRKKPKLTLAIHGSDQEATEFLNRKQFEELVANARRIMGWT
jgi:hypothetical protein